MSKRFILIFLLLLWSISALAQVVHERWPIKTSYHVITNKPRKIKLSTLLKLKMPVLAPGEKQKDYDAKLLPGKFRTFREGDFVETTGWIHYILHEGDDDYHVQVSGSSRTGDHCVIVEIPDPVNAGDADLRDHWTAARAFIEGLNKGKQAPKSGKKVQAVFVKIRGQLFYDLSHTPNQKRGRGGMSAGTI